MGARRKRIEDDLVLAEGRQDQNPPACGRHDLPCGCESVEAHRAAVCEAVTGRLGGTGCRSPTAGGGPPPCPALPSSVARRLLAPRPATAGLNARSGGRPPAAGRWSRCWRRASAEPRNHQDAPPFVQRPDRPGSLSTGGLRVFGCVGCSILNRFHGSRDRTPLRPHRPGGRGCRARRGVAVRRAAGRDTHDRAVLTDSRSPRSARSQNGPGNTSWPTMPPRRR